MARSNIVSMEKRRERLDAESAKRTEERMHHREVWVAARGLASACRDLVSDPYDPYYQDAVTHFSGVVENLTGGALSE